MSGLHAFAVLAALAGGIAIGVVFGAGMTFLIMRTERADRLDRSEASARSGVSS